MSWATWAGSARPNTQSVEPTTTTSPPDDPGGRQVSMTLLPWRTLATALGLPPWMRSTMNSRSPWSSAAEIGFGHSPTPRLLDCVYATTHASAGRIDPANSGSAVATGNRSSRNASRQERFVAHHTEVGARSHGRRNATCVPPVYKLQPPQEL